MTFTAGNSKCTIAARVWNHPAMNFGMSIKKCASKQYTEQICKPKENTSIRRYLGPLCTCELLCCAAFDNTMASSPYILRMWTSHLTPHLEFFVWLWLLCVLTLYHYRHKHKNCSHDGFPQSYSILSCSYHPVIFPEIFNQCLEKCAASAQLDLPRAVKYQIVIICKTLQHITEPGLSLHTSSKTNHLIALLTGNLQQGNCARLDSPTTDNCILQPILMNHFIL